LSATATGSAVDVFGASTEACELEVSLDGDSVSAWAIPPVAATVIHVESRNAASVNRGHKRLLDNEDLPPIGMQCIQPTDRRFQYRQSSAMPEAMTCSRRIV
jgi:hypothetical protein